MIRRMRGLISVGLLAAVLPAAAHGVRLHDVRFSSGSGGTRAVLDLSARTKPHVFTVDDPRRVVVDLPHTRDTGHVAGPVASSRLIRDIRTGVHHGSTTRVVFDMTGAAHVHSFLLAPGAGHRYRLVLDFRTARAPPKRAARSGHAAAGHARAAPGARDIVVAIDPGHGGRDPGAHGPDDVLEKNVTLAIARRLERMVDDQPHMRAVLTRTGDYYVGLRKRMVIARHDKADFFISIHCDASPDGGDARGASVYALSRHGATSEHARLLARRENAADLVGGVSLKHKNAKLASFVLDLSQNASIAASLDAGRRVLNQLDTLGTLHKSRVQQADFMVLKSPDIPSILVETNFISNPRTEHELAHAAYQTRLAAAMLRGIKGYFARYSPSANVAAGQRHRVRHGDTLYAIARLYGVSVAALRHYNHLHGSLIHVGRMLKIPPPGGAPQQVASRG